MNTARKGRIISKYFNWLLVKDVIDRTTILDKHSARGISAQQKGLDYLQALRICRSERTMMTG